MTEVVIKGPLAQRLARKAREKGMDIDSYLARLLANDMSSAERIGLYVELHESYMAEAEELAREGKLEQAGEKMWGAVCALLNAIGEQRGWRHYSHRDYCDIIEALAEELGMPELSAWFASAERLHANYYHGFLREATFKHHAEAVKKLVGELRKLLPER